MHYGFFYAKILFVDVFGGNAFNFRSSVYGCYKNVYSKHEMTSSRLTDIYDEFNKLKFFIRTNYFIKT